MKRILFEHIRAQLRNRSHCKYHLEQSPSARSQQLIINATNEALNKVPYYQHYHKPIDRIEEISQFPLLSKADILHAPDKSFVTRRAFRWFTQKIETGGTSGTSLRVYRQPREVFGYQQVANYAFSCIGKHLKIAQLRGTKPAKGLVAQNVGPMLILSSYLLNEQNLDQYLSELRDNHISCLHVYPSSLVILARLIKKRYGAINLPDLKGILASSEIFAIEDKKLVKEVFGGVKIVDFYGLNELCCAAIAVDFEPFLFFQDYGYVELIDSGRTTSQGNRIAQIVATSVMNKTMPLIRYATEDYVELDSRGQIIAIIGRTSDFLVNAHNQLIPCIFLNRDISFTHVTNFQFYQDTPGQMTFRVVVDSEFGPTDVANLMEDLTQSFVDVKPRVEIVDHIEKTRIGKQRRLVQLLNLKDYQ